jgi:hypothetical protein
MKKCTICLIGTWTVGLAAMAWGALALLGIDLMWPIWGKIMAVTVGLTGLGFLYYQPPMKPCPRCASLNRL